MIVSTRESQRARERVLHLGISQISGGSRTSVGGYAEPEKENDSAQFDVSDNRTLDEVVGWLMELGYIPSFCTACYRAGRTGDRFYEPPQERADSKLLPSNALMTLKEYLIDYASPHVKELGDELIAKEIHYIPNEKVRELVERHLKDIEEGERDFRI